MNIAKIVRDALADTAERSTRHRQRMTILQVLIGNPLMGAMYGLASNAVAWVICLTPTPVEFITAAILAAMTPMVFDHQSSRIAPDVGDASNRGLTRVFGLPWIPSHRRPSIHWDGEPWRTTVIVMLVLATVANSGPTAGIVPVIAGSTWLTSIAAGAIVASVRGIATKQTWEGLLRRGTIAT